MTHMTGWRRLGILVSALWVLFIIGFAVYETATEPRFGSFSFFERVYTSTPLDPNRDYGVNPWFISTQSSEDVFLFWFFLGALVVPPAALWGLGFALRWVAQGFRTNTADD